jgi:hypothetical protein
MPEKENLCNQEQKLWYKKPAANWNEALPIGDCIIYAKHNIFVGSNGISINVIQNGNEYSFRTKIGKEYVVTFN